MSSQPRVTPADLARLRDRLTERDIGVVQAVSDLRLMSASQIQTLAFPAEDHESADAAARAARRSLAQLTEHRLLTRAGRRLGGVRAGSSGFLYGLGPVGQRVIGLDGPRRRFREPSALYVDHTLAISELVVALRLAERGGRCEVLELQAEPTCWRNYSGLAGRQVLRPDLFINLAVGQYERRFFVELDRGSEHLPALVRKCRSYELYYRSGTEQDANGVFPRVCWIVPDSTRAQRIQTAISSNRDLTPEMFIVVENSAADAVLIGGES